MIILKSLKNNSRWNSKYCQGNIVIKYSKHQNKDCTVPAYVIFLILNVRRKNAVHYFWFCIKNVYIESKLYSSQFVP